VWSFVRSFGKFQKCSVTYRCRAFDPPHIGATSQTAGASHELLEHWVPKIASILDRLHWLGEIELWARDTADGFRRLNWPQVDGSPEEPPASIWNALQHPGAVALIRKGHVVKLHPLGRKLPYRNSDRYLAQIFARRDKPGLIYHLFGAENALQSVSTPTELKHLDEIFDIQSVRSGQKQTLFGEYNYGDLEKLKQPAIVGIFGVNSTESNREQTGIICGQIWGA
jgi:hypothetical protein